MSEDLKREPVIQELARLKPTAAGIDRDGMLFACGRASAPAARPWKIAATALAALQVATLGLWLTGARGDRHPVAPPAGIETQSDTPTAPTFPSVPAGSYGDLVRQWNNDGLPPLSAATDSAADQPTLLLIDSRHLLETD